MSEVCMFMQSCRAELRNVLFLIGFLMVNCALLCNLRPLGFAVAENIGVLQSSLWCRLSNEVGC